LLVSIVVAVDRAMPKPQFRKWATQVARQAGEELDAAVASRLLSIAEDYDKLAQREEATACSPEEDSEGELTNGLNHS
jgi:hypothetical protein